ncbi:MAG: phenylalanine--tRNA ligase subunit alpha [Synergistaceae bacterium]|jgi:phenylalanyl-tRNA synthetase alpha chain|nr:phenylalanine--tRNA ligase subunit alpha [Synergistaceae bacterium]
MSDLDNQVREVKSSFDRAAGSTTTTDGLQELKVRYLGKKGALTVLLKSLKDLSPEERPLAGEVLNTLRDELERKIENKKQALTRAEDAAAEAMEKIDVTLPPRGRPAGAFHPVAQTMHEIVSIMQGLGYSVALGPEIEEDHYNFECLNMPSWHPARDMQDTFYLSNPEDAGSGSLLLRTHTSPVQIRSMLRYGAPLRIVCPGKVYRRDNDPTHSPMFNQLEGLLIEENVSFSILKGSLVELMNGFFGRELKNRFRASYFPFTEPSMELDIECVDCGGKNPGCRVCKGTGWLEVCGLGMVHPFVVRSGGIDPEKYNGFAFGMGLDRMAMLKYGINDLRYLFNGNVSYFLSGRNVS